MRTAAAWKRADEGETALAYKYQEGDVLMAHANRNGFRGGFSTFSEAATVEDHTDELSERSNEKTARTERDSDILIFLSAAASLRDLAERVEAAETVMDIRASAEAPEFGFRFLHGKVELSAGPGGTFARAHRSFAHSQPLDISKGIQLAVFLADRAEAAEHEPDHGFCALVANLGRPKRLQVRRPRLSWHGTWQKACRRFYAHCAEPLFRGIADAEGCTEAARRSPGSGVGGRARGSRAGGRPERSAAGCVYRLRICVPRRSR